MPVHTRKTKLEVLALLVANDGDVNKTTKEWNEAEDARQLDHQDRHPKRAPLLDRHVNISTVSRWKVMFKLEYHRLAQEFYDSCRGDIIETWHRFLLVAKYGAAKATPLQAAMAWSIFDKHLALANGMPTERTEVASVDDKIAAIERERDLRPRNDANADAPEDEPLDDENDDDTDGAEEGGDIDHGQPAPGPHSTEAPAEQPAPADCPPTPDEPGPDPAPGA